MFKLNRKNGVSYYTITSFEETGLVKHGFSTREGGVSDGCYSSMNFRFHCDDTRENVLKNFEIMADTLGMDYNKLMAFKTSSRRCYSYRDRGRFRKRYCA